MLDFVIMPCQKKKKISKKMLPLCPKFETDLGLFMSIFLLIFTSLVRYITLDFNA